MSIDSPDHLQRQVAWQMVYNQLCPASEGFPEQSWPLLPCNAPCPACKGSLSIYQDTIHPGQWLYCHSCHRSGDPIMFAAKCWNIDIEHAARRLLPDVSQDDLADYQRVVVEAYRRTDDFWSGAQKHLLASSDLRGARVQLGVSPTLQGDQWPERGGHLLGGASRKAIEDCVGFAPHRSIFYKPNNNRAVMPPPLKEDLLVVPLYDLPGRISSMLFVSGFGQMSEEITYYAGLPYARRSNLRTVPGVLGLDLAPTHRYSTCPNLLVLDPLLAVRLLVKHMAKTSQPLHVLGAWHGAPPCTSIKMKKQDTVVWGHQADLQLFRHAIALNAMVTISTAKLQDVKRQLEKSNPSVWVNHQINHAKPWTDVLEEQLARMTAIDAENMLLQLEMPVDQLKRFINGCRPSVRSSLNALYQQRCCAKQVDIGSNVLFESDGSWWLQGKSSPMSNAIVRIEKVAHLTDTDQIFCRGTVTSQGRSAAFVVDKNKIDSPKSWTWLTDFMLEKDLGMLESCRNRFGPSVYTMAVAFHRPEMTKGSSSSGWNESSASFTFPTFQIKMGGEVEDNWVPVAHKQKVTLGESARPAGLEAADIRLLSEGPTADLAWSLSLAAIYNVMADAWGYSTSGFVLAGSAQTAGIRMAKALGCPSMPPCREYLRRSNPRHVGLPLVIDGMSMYSEAWMRWLTDGNHNHVIRLAPFQARLCTVYGGWIQIAANRPLEAGNDIVASLRKVVPNYLKDLAERRLQTHSTAVDAMDRIAKDVEDWFVRQGGNPRGVRAGQILMVRDRPVDAADAFMKTLYQLMDEGQLQFARQGFLPPPTWKNPGSTLVYMPDEPSAVWVPQVDLQRIIAKHHMPALDISRISEGLAACGAFVGEEEYDGQPGWRIQERWWDAMLSAWRSRGKST